MRGLDKTVFYHVQIIAYDINYLRQLDNGKQVIVFPKGREGGDTLQHLHLIDRELGIELKHGYVKERGKMCWYTHLMLTTPEGKSNVVPKTTKQLIEEYLPSLVEAVFCKYSVELDMSNLKYRQLEFNFTFKLRQPFRNYHKVFKYMQTNGTKYFKRENTPQAHKADAVPSYYLANSSRSLKIYCKRQDQMEYCRIEYSLYMPEVIKNALGTNKVIDLEDTQLHKYFVEQFKKDILIPCRNALALQNKAIIKQVRQLQSRGVTEIIKLGWELDSKDKILDLIQLYNAIKVVDKNNAYRSIKKIDEGMKLECLRENIDRLNEIEASVLNEQEIVIQYVVE